MIEEVLLTATDFQSTAILPNLILHARCVLIPAKTPQLSLYLSTFLKRRSSSTYLIQTDDKLPSRQHSTSI